MNLSFWKAASSHNLHPPHLALLSPLSPRLVYFSHVMSGQGHLITVISHSLRVIASQCEFSGCGRCMMTQAATSVSTWPIFCRFPSSISRGS